MHLLEQRIQCRTLHRLPRTPRPPVSGVRRSRVLETRRKEHPPPALAVVSAELRVVVQPCHACDDIPDAAPVVEAAMQCNELGVRRLHGEKAERSAQQSAARV